MITSYLKSELSLGHSIMIGVNEGGISTENANEDTQHFINIVGMGYEQGSNYFEYYDNGCRYEYKGADVKNNRLYLNLSNGYFEDINTNRNCPFYRITEIRINK